MTALTCVGAFLFAGLAVIVIAGMWLTRWLFGDTNGRPRL